MKKIFLSALLACAIFTTSKVNAQELPAATAKLLEIKDEKAVQAEIVKLLKGTEKDQSAVVYYYYQKGEQQKAEDLSADIAKKYPKGETAAQQLAMKVYRTADMTEVATYVNQFLKDFPTQPTATLYMMAANSATKARDLPKFLDYWAKIDDQNSKDMMLKACGPAFIKNNPKEMKVIFDGILAKLDFSEKSRKQFFDLKEIDSDIQYELKDYPKALENLEAVYLFKDKKSPDLLAKYANLLFLNKQYAKHIVIADSIMKQGKGNELLKTQLKESFAAAFPAQDVNQYFASMDLALQERVSKDVVSHLIKEKAPDVKFTDVNGKVVSLADYKGKYVVLDFWATWCGPCKKSFPAMQQAVNKFKGDKEVEFLFIHTWESSKKPVEDATAYLKDNNFTFNLLMDLKDASTNKNPAVTAFDVKGIPAKFIIDKEGYIRYKGSGFGGGDDELVAELTALIEAVKKG